MSFLELAFLIFSLVGAPDNQETRAIAGAATLACHGNEKCIVDAAVFAKHESSFQIDPRPVSADAKAGRSCGAWQTPCYLKSLEQQAYAWVRLRRQSLETCGTLAQLASGFCDKGTKVAEARAVEAWGVEYALHWSELP